MDSVESAGMARGAQWNTKKMQTLFDVVRIAWRWRITYAARQ